MPPQNELQQHHIITDRKEQQHPKIKTAPFTMSKNDLIFNSSSGAVVDYTNWGFPGYLTEEEYAVYVSHSHGKFLLLSLNGMWDI